MFFKLKALQKCCSHKYASYQGNQIIGFLYSRVLHKSSGCFQSLHAESRWVRSKGEHGCCYSLLFLTAWPLDQKRETRGSDLEQAHQELQKKSLGIWTKGTGPKYNVWMKIQTLPTMWGWSGPGSCLELVFRSNQTRLKNEDWGSCWRLWAWFCAEAERRWGLQGANCVSLIQCCQAIAQAGTTFHILLPTPRVGFHVGFAHLRLAVLLVGYVQSARLERRESLQWRE